MLVKTLLGILTHNGQTCEETAVTICHDITEILLLWRKTTTNKQRLPCYTFVYIIYHTICHATYSKAHNIYGNTGVVVLFTFE